MEVLRVSGRVALSWERLRSCEQEAGGCCEDDGGDEGVEASDVPGKGLCFAVCGGGVHCGLLGYVASKSTCTPLVTIGPS